MLDYDGDARVSYEELVAAIRECWGVGSAVANRESRELEALLGRMAAYLRGQAVSVGWWRALAVAIALCSDALMSSDALSPCLCLHLCVS